MSDTPTTPRPHSSTVVDGNDRAPARSMLRAVGFTDEDFNKPQIAVASSASDMTPCNVHLGDLSEHARAGVAAAGGKPVYFNTITVTDGISMGTKGMRYSLVSRDVIADSIETAVAAEGFDGLIAIGGCDKNMPGAMIAIARLNRPAVFIYGGTILPGFTPGDRWISSRSSRPSANMPRARSTTPVSRKLRLRQFPARVPVAACIPPTPWRPPSRCWA